MLFYEALQKIPPNAITIEIAPHCLMQAILRRNLQKTCTNVGLMNSKAENELESFLQASIFSDNIMLVFSAVRSFKLFQ